jgi:hypothetical protein
VTGEQLSLEPLLAAASESSTGIATPPLKLSSKSLGGRRYGVFDHHGDQVGAVWDGGGGFVRWYSKGEVGSGTADNRDIAIDQIRRDLENTP